jgi:hypothetical protein
VNCDINFAMLFSETYAIMCIVLAVLDNFMRLMKVPLGLEGAGVLLGLIIDSRFSCTC